METSFSSFCGLTVLIISRNCDSARPDSLTGEPENFGFLTDTLHSVDRPPDVVVFGFQEVIDLESQKTAAKNALLGGKEKGNDGGLSDKVAGAYKRWYHYLIIAVKTAMPKNTSFSVANTESLVGLFSCIFVKSSERATFDDVVGRHCCPFRGWRLVFLFHQLSSCCWSECCSTAQCGYCWNVEG